MIPVTVQPTRDQLRALAGARIAKAAEWNATANPPMVALMSDRVQIDAGDLLSLLDQLDQAEAERDQAEAWAEERSYPLVMSQGEILTGVANALNGPTPPLTSWSHHDLAEKARAMVERAERAEARIKAVQDVLDEPDAMIGPRVHVAVDRILRALGSVPPPGQ